MTDLTRRIRIKARNLVTDIETEHGVVLDPQLREVAIDRIGAALTDRDAASIAGGRLLLALDANGQAVSCMFEEWAGGGLPAAAAFVDKYAPFGAVRAVLGRVSVEVSPATTGSGPAPDGRWPVDAIEECIEAMGEHGEGAAAMGALAQLRALQAAAGRKEVD